jgi:lipid-binding SYLF domain-containing protein
MQETKSYFWTKVGMCLLCSISGAWRRKVGTDVASEDHLEQERPTMRKTSGATMSLAIAAAMIAISACTQEPADGISADLDRAGRADQTAADDETTVRDEQTETASNAQSLVDSAVGTVDRLRADRQAAALLRQAHGIFIIPKYGESGQGVTLLKRGVAGSEALDEAGAAVDVAAAQWSGPVFYDFGGVTAGAEAGVEVGSIVMLLISEQAAELFRTSQTDFAIDAGAGMAIFDFSARAEAAAGRGDIIVWTDTAGAFARATIGIDGINLDEEGTAAYYGTDIDAHRILNGELMSDRGQPLLDALTG